MYGQKSKTRFRKIFEKKIQSITYINHLTPRISKMVNHYANVQIQGNSEEIKNVITQDNIDN